jgi:hypothetical protein
MGGTMAGLKLTPVRFGDFLVEKKILNEGQLLDVLADHWIAGCHIGEAAVRRGYLSRDELSRRLAEFENLATLYI